MLHNRPMILTAVNFLQDKRIEGFLFMWCICANASFTALVEEPLQEIKISGEFQLLNIATDSLVVDETFLETEIAAGLAALIGIGWVRDVR